MSTETVVKNIVAASKRLAEADPQSEAVQRTVKELQDQISLLNELAKKDKGSPWGSKSMKDDVAFIGEQIKTLKSAAAAPAANYRRIFNILASLEKVWDLASRPQNAAVRPKIASVIEKVAGVFAEVDTVDDLNKPLETIEKAVHSLYSGGKMNDPSTYYFGQRGKGHHEKKD